MTDQVSAGTILVVDDDAELRELLQEYLSKNEFEVNVAENGRAMDTKLMQRSYDLLILDLMMPGEDGLSIAKRIKQNSDQPIIILSALGEDVDRIIGLEIGADDYLPKPFHPRELLARIRAVMRRTGAVTYAGPPRSEYVFGDFRFDIDMMRLYHHGKDVEMTSGELEFLRVLVQNPNRVLNRDRILELLTGRERSPFDRSIDVRVTRLRSKIEDSPASPKFIRTIRGKGYMFCPNAQ